MKNEPSLHISTTNEDLDFEMIHEFLSKAYWSEGRTLKEVETSVNASLNFGLFLNKQQIGFARVLTDYAVFAYLMDVFILPEFRGNGYSKILLEAVFSHPKIHASRWMLATKDAHSLYANFGFSPLSSPDRLMEKLS